MAKEIKYGIEAREALEFSIDDTIDIIRDNEVKKERNKDAR